MFTHALPLGSLRPIEALPPTLTPNAIFAMAPPAPRRLGFLGACIIYAGCGLAMTLAPSLNVGNLGGTKTARDGFTVPEERPHIDVDLNPVKPPPPAHFRELTSKAAPVRDAAWTPPAPINDVPETPNVLPTTSRFGDSIRGGDNVSNVQAPVGAGPDDGRAVAGAGPTTLDYEFNQMRVLSRVDPMYPALAKLAKVQGEVVLLMLVDPHGIPSEVKALSGPHPSLEQEAMRVARMWRFEPARLNGQAVSAQFRLTIVFRLR